MQENLFDLSGKIALITGAGANGGIGHALALGFSHYGAEVIAADIEQTVRELGHAVSGICASAALAVQSAKDAPPGLVLADIQLAGAGTGLDAANMIQKSVDAPVVFVTAFPERLLTGARPEPTYLVMKPFVPAALKAMIAQALFFHPARVEP